MTKWREGTNILDAFNYNANLDVGIQNINVKNIIYHRFILSYRFILDDDKISFSP